MRKNPCDLFSCSIRHKHYLKNKDDNDTLKTKTEYLMISDKASVGFTQSVNLIFNPELLIQYPGSQEDILYGDNQVLF